MAFKVVLNDVASYKIPSVLESDKKVTLIYGLNGAGKSTISNYLYSPTLPVYRNCRQEGFSGADVLVYNSRFVRDNFYEIDKLNGIFTLSKVNKDVEAKIAEITLTISEVTAIRDNLLKEKDSVDQSIAAVRSACEDAVWKIKTRYSGGDRVMEYCLDGLKSKARLFEHISSLSLKPEEDHRSIDAIKRDVETLQGDNPRAFPEIPKFIEDSSAYIQKKIFSKVIVGKTDSPVSELIAKLNNADWVSQGISYMDRLESEGSQACPFCQKPSLNAETVNFIREYFDKSFNDDVSALKTAEVEYNYYAYNQPDIATHLENPFLADRLAEFKALHAQLSTGISQNSELITQKLKTPSLQIDLASFDNVSKSLNEIIAQVNRQTVEHNERVANKKSALEKLKIEFWQRCRFEYDAAVTAYLTSADALTEKRAQAKCAFDQAKEKLTALNNQLVDLQKQTVNVDATITSINDRLHRIGIDSFKITNAGDNRYRLSRDGTSAEDFMTLSEGEKTVISFIYFLELCKGRRSPIDTSNSRIVVIDDPISSLSHIYVFHIGQLIKEHLSNSDRFSHLIILTHSLYFFYELADMKKERREERQKLLRITKSSTGSVIREMKYEEIQNDYQAYWGVVMDEHQHPALIANCMRIIIEYFFNFLHRKDLNNVFQMVALRDTSHQAFCRFMNRESHSLGQNIFDYKEFDYKQFKDAFKLVFECSGFPEHYNAMAK